MSYFKPLAFALLILCSALPRAWGGEPSFGLGASELTDYEHLSTGADFFPYEWLIHMKSATYKGADGKQAPFFADLDRRFNFLPSKDPSRYLLPYTGMTASWANASALQSDALRADPWGSMRTLPDGKKSIRVIGTNCAACHLGGVTRNGAFYPIQAMPGAIDMNGFFTDFALSVLQLLARPDVTRDFLMNFGYSKPQATAEALAAMRGFVNELGLDAGKRGMLARFETWNDIVAVRTFLDAARGDFNRLNQVKGAMKHALERLIKLTYKVDASELGDVSARLDFPATFLCGDSANLKVVPFSFGRFDASDRPANLVIGKPLFDVNAPVRIAPMWSKKYTAMYHYSSNTNSFYGRGIIAAYAGGVGVLDDQGATTINLNNLVRIKNMIFKLAVPSWTEVFSTAPSDPALRINTSITARGKQLYELKCASCHEVKRAAGPRQELYDYKIFSYDVLGTDPREAANFKGYGEIYNKALFDRIRSLRDAYYAKYNVPEKTQLEWQEQDLRGLEFFRETIEGATGLQAKFGTNYGDIAPGGYYRAVHLSGAWALRTFLHNGSVPTLWDLLSPSSKRPKYFNTKSREFDPVKVGEVNTRDPNRPCGKKETEGCVDTTSVGSHNAGHENRPGLGYDFGTDLSREDKLALIEYLKILPPEPEYR